MIAAFLNRIVREPGSFTPPERPATVTFQPESGDERVVTIVGIDELDSGSERISWRSLLAMALLKARAGDVVTLRTPRGPERLEVLAIRYDPVA